ncbi:MAG: Ig-like domain-containing protein [Flavobacteriaceae bacterium]
MRLKITLFLFANILYFNQLYAQSCNADFEERNGIAIVEADSKLSGGWSRRSISGASGGAALYYAGSNQFNSPGTSVITYILKVNTPGTYRVIWRNQIGKISTGPEPATTEHNDSWLKINGADFYGQSGSRRVYPGGSGKSPVAAGATSGGWFKIYTNTLGWNWETKTSDHNAHQVYVRFASAGNYNVQLSARSQDHIVDRIVLYNESSYTAAQAQSLTRAATSCSGSTTPPPTTPTPPPTTPTPPATNNPPSVSFSNLTSGQNFNVGSTISVGLSASDSDGSITRHQIFVNNALVDTDGTSYTPFQLTNAREGSYAIRATVTDNSGATTSATVNVTVSGGSTPPPPPTPPTAGNVPPTVSFTNLSNGQQVVVGSTVSVGLSASDSDGSIAKYQIFVNGLLVDTDGANYTPHPIRNIAAGNYAIRATVTDNRGGVASATVNITAAASGSTPSSLITFDLIDASSNASIGALTDGAIISSSKTQGINVRATVPSNAGSVGFELSGAQTRVTTENIFPYALFGDVNGNYVAGSLASGSYRLIVAAYAGANRTGGTIAIRTINFTVSGTSGKSSFAFPNPIAADGKVSVRLPEGSSGQFSYSVTNALGVQLEQGQFSVDRSNTDVDLQLSNVGRQVQGVYYLNLSSAGSRESIPLIRE